MNNLINVGDLVIQPHYMANVGYCYKTREDCVFIKWFSLGQIITEQHWYNGEIEDWINNGSWRVVRRKHGSI